MPSHRESPVRTIHGRIIRESEKAILFVPMSISGQKVPTQAAQWFPFSQISKLMRTGIPGEDWIIVSEWIIEQKKLNLTPAEILDGSTTGVPSDAEMEDDEDPGYRDPPEDPEDTYERMTRGE